MLLLGGKYINVSTWGKQVVNVENKGIDNSLLIDVFKEKTQRRRHKIEYHGH